MAEHERVNLKLSISQFKERKEAVKSNNGATLRIGNKNFIKEKLIHELFLTERQINKLREKVENNMSTDIRLSKTQINTKIKLGENLGKLLMGSLPKLIKPAISLGKNILAPLGLTAAMSATHAAVQKKKKNVRKWNNNLNNF